MSSDFNRLRLEQIEQALEPYLALRGRSAPAGGWLKAIREALGRPLRGQAARLHISAPTLLKSEAAEARDRITLGQLRKLAAGLDCELIYALVPREPLSKVVEAQAEQRAAVERRDLQQGLQLGAGGGPLLLRHEPIGARRQELHPARH